MTASTLFDKVWKAHECAGDGRHAAVLYIDLHLVHEVTSPRLQRTAVVEAAGPAARPYARHHGPFHPDDHGSGVRNVPIKWTRRPAGAPTRAERGGFWGSSCSACATRRDAGSYMSSVPNWAPAVRAMTHRVRRQSYEHPWRFRRLAFGIGSTKSVMCWRPSAAATQHPSRLPSTWTGHCRPGLRQGSDSCHHRQSGRVRWYRPVFEYRGSTIRALSMDERMTICNMSIEAGARAVWLRPTSDVRVSRGATRAPRGVLGPRVSRAGRRS